MSCLSCGSEKQAEFTAEMVIHFMGLKNLDKLGVWLFPALLVCLDCGFCQFIAPETELASLAEGTLADKSSSLEENADDATFGMGPSLSGGDREDGIMPQHTFPVARLLDAVIPCESCKSVNQKKFSAQMGIHFPGLKNIDKPTVWVFSDVMVCLDCGTAEFAVPEEELRQLAKRDAATG
jgi:hypothetical protein